MSRSFQPKAGDFASLRRILEVGVRGRVAGVVELEIADDDGELAVGGDVGRATGAGDRCATHTRDGSAGDSGPSNPRRIATAPGIDASAAAIATAAGEIAFGSGLARASCRRLPGHPQSPTT